MSKVRIGIDVGGTYTDAVAIDNDTYEIIGKLKIPTTHNAEEGVSKGIILILNQLMEEHNIQPEDVTFISHGTTQATNALLEGDVAKVGIFGMSTGIDKRSAIKDTNPGNIELADNRYLETEHIFYDSNDLSDETVEEGLNELISNGSEVIVASESYSIEDSANEQKVLKKARKKNMLATGGYEISELYGLKMRTRTAVVNASLIPKMLETAEMTEKSVNSSGIESSLMIMRCDGGVMNVDEVQKRPILTMLSGLAAGVAGALMYEKISDGIFFEVGGTSIDISVIKNGSVMLQNAEVGGHKTYVTSLDVRTLGVAGGSMVIVEDGKIIGVGPRSAHIANIPYECFTPEEEMEGLSIQYISPLEDDTSHYVVAENNKGAHYSYTLAGAANLLGYVPDDDYAHGKATSNKKAWDALGKHLGISGEEAARKVMDIAVKKVSEVVDQLIQEYELTKSFSVLVGGGGSASIVIPALAEYQDMKFQIAKNAPYISTIGVALAMVREQMERSVINPTEQDIKRIRSDIFDKIVKSGANEKTVDISIEIDAQKNILRAIATGSTELRTKDLTTKNMPIEKMKKVVSDSLGQAEGEIEEVAASERWHVFESTQTKKKLFGLLKSKDTAVAVLDREGIVRLKAKSGHVQEFNKKNVRVFDEFIDEYTYYSDANATPPKVYLFFKEKMVDLTGVQSKEQILSIAEVELESVEEESTIIAVCYQ
ncbi:hydantoinase/oxoprolinase family protein [Marinilactibacillus psychrotolerans]|uniref:Hydantoinase/oxoprolinase family protein n=1 Tax=Marinilactibacillus psychrotolerans TaxID=191770 RepID=A0A5R9C7A7_9LACT|nr:hydantoinase/oxoprolinase family protein [Marinilactibacillus psychrotolerans]TLQ09000.1 hydantoinase/oxoprolinase family protein [Marinilactibacillus psychrotolerans]